MLKIAKFKKRILLIILILFPLSVVICFAEKDTKDIYDPNVVFEGVWRTDSGSVYEYREGEMICVSVHRKKFAGWLNKAALKNFRKTDNRWFADQAIRFHDSGVIKKWLTADIEIKDGSFIKTIKKKFNGILKKDCEPQLWNKIK